MGRRNRELSNTEEVYESRGLGKNQFFQSEKIVFFLIIIHIEIQLAFTCAGLSFLCQNLTCIPFCVWQLGSRLTWQAPF